jgi:hypothetical protein
MSMDRVGVRTNVGSIGTAVVPLLAGPRGACKIGSRNTPLRAT